MTPPQTHERMQRLASALAAVGLPSAVGLTPVAEPAIYPNAAFVRMNPQEILQVTFPAPPTAEQVAAVEQFVAAWDDSDAATAAAKLKEDRTIVDQLIDGDVPDKAEARHFARALRITMRATQQVVASMRRKINELAKGANVSPLPAFTFTELRALAKTKNRNEQSPTED